MRMCCPFMPGFEPVILSLRWALACDIILLTLDRLVLSFVPSTLCPREGKHILEELGLNLVLQTPKAIHLTFRPWLLGQLGRVRSIRTPLSLVIMLRLRNFNSKQNLQIICNSANGPPHCLTSTSSNLFST